MAFPQAFNAVSGLSTLSSTFLGSINESNFTNSRSFLREDVLIVSSSQRKLAVVACSSTMVENFSLATNDTATAKAARAEALALVRAARKAAKEAAAVAQMQRVVEKNFNSNLSNEDFIRIGLARMENGFHNGLLDLNNSNCLKPKLTKIKNGKTFKAHENESLSISSVSELPNISQPTLHTEPKPTQSEAEGSPSNGIVIRSKRRTERLNRRVRALEKAEKNYMENEIPTKEKKPVVKASLFGDATAMQIFVGTMANQRLLTAAEEIELSRHIQELLKLEKLKSSFAENLGREPTVMEWAKLVGLTPRELHSKLRKGQECRDKMVHANMRLVVSVAKKYLGRGMALEDLITDGCMGLLRSVDKFDFRKGFKFSTYAHWWIRQAVVRAINDKSRTIRLPVHLHEVISRINKAKRMLEEEYGRPANDHEVAELVGMTADKLSLLMRNIRLPSSMDRPIGRDGDATLGEIVSDPKAVSPEDFITDRMMRKDVENALHTLNPRERDVVRLRYGLDNHRARTLEEVGQLFNVTRERIRQIETKALRKLRQPMHNLVLQDYVGQNGTNQVN